MHDKLMYALYKGDQLLSVGTIYQIANEMNVKIDTIYFYKTPAYLKRTGANARILIKVEDD